MTPYLSIQALQRRIPLLFKHPKSLQIPNRQQKNLSMSSDCITPPLSPGFKGTSPNSYYLCKAKQMFPNSQTPAACEVPIGCSTKERQERGCVCASVLRRGEGCETCSQYPNALPAPRRLSPSEPARHTQRQRQKKKPEPKPGGMRQAKRPFPG